MSDRKFRVSRRDVLRGAGAAAFIGAVTGTEVRAQSADGLRRVGPGAAKVEFMLNGKKTVLTVEPRVTLLDALRDRVGLTGTKRICDRGACGGCTVWVERQDREQLHDARARRGRRAGHDDRGARRPGDKLIPMQEAFVKHDAAHVRLLHPRHVMSCAALTRRDTKNPTDAQIRAGASPATSAVAAPTRTSSRR